MENNLSPMTWLEFKNLEKDAQRDYLQQLINTFGANAVSFSEMFHVGAQAVRKYIADADLGITLNRGRRVDRVRWNEFIGANSDNEEGSPADAMQLNSLSMQFSGKIDVDSISATLHKIFDGAANGEIAISCKVFGGNEDDRK